MNKNRVLQVLSLAAFFLVLCVLCRDSYKKPWISFDTAVYVSMLRGNDLETIKHAVQDCRQNIPGPEATCASNGTAESQQLVKDYTAEDYREYLRFYTVKPLYVALGSLLHKAFGVEAFQALRLISVASYFLLGLVCAAWLCEYLQMPLALVVSLLLLQLPAISSLSRALLPDCLSTLLLIAAVYLVLYRVQNPAGQMVLLAIPPLVRPDNLLLCVLMAGVLVYRRAAGRQQALRSLLFLAAGVVTYYLALRWFTHPLPWAALFIHSFVNFLPPSTYAGSHIEPWVYLKFLKRGAPIIFTSYVVGPILLAILVLADRKSDQKLRDVVLVSSAAVALRVALYPNAEGRYFAWYLLLMGLCAFASLGLRFSARTVAATQG